MSTDFDRENADGLEQVDQDLQRVIKATEAVDWSKVSEISVDDVAKWNQKLQYARNCVQAKLEQGT